MTQAEEHEGPVVHDRRRIDPQTGELREGARRSAPPTGPAPGEGPDASVEGEAGAQAAEVEALKVALAERTNDLQRLQAEYVNYKRRVDRDRQAVQDLAVGGVLTELLPVLDDIGRAREHGELSGGFKAVAETLESSLTKLGLVKYGEVGEEFDPRVHEALMHAYSDDVTGPTCSAILQPGYRHGERILRPARVAVAEPTAGLPQQAAETGEQVESTEQGDTSEAGGPGDRQSPSDGG